MKRDVHTQFDVDQCVHWKCFGLYTFAKFYTFICFGYERASAPSLISTQVFVHETPGLYVSTQIRRPSGLVCLR